MSKRQTFFHVSYARAEQIKNFYQKDWQACVDFVKDQADELGVSRF